MGDEQHRQQDYVRGRGGVSGRDDVAGRVGLPIRNGDAPLRALESAQGYLAGSAEAGCSGDGGSASFNSSFKAFVEWGEANGLIRPERDFPFFGRAPDGSGDEHECWFDEVTNLWLKATFHNRFGVAWGREGSATAGEYLTRLVLQNRYFGDDIHLVALVESRERLRVLTSQPHVAGEAAGYTEIQEWFGGLGFRRLEACGSIAWYLRSENLLVADAHEGNVIRTRNGMLVPIDLNLMQPVGEMLVWVEALLGDESCRGDGQAVRSKGA